MAEYSCYRHSIVVIPIYETLGSNVCVFIAKQAKLTAIFCDTLTRVDGVLKNVKECDTLKHIIVASAGSDAALQAMKEKAVSYGLQLHSMDDIEGLGKINPQADHPPEANDLAVICYTSGTTDAPKGVMLSHENIVANFSAILHHLVDYRLCETDTLISYLPLGHMFERVCEWGVLAVGGKVGYFSGDIKLLSDDMKIIQPTMFPCVPRVLNKIYGRIQETVSSSFIKSWLLNMAYESKRKQLANKVYDNNTIWDHLVFSKIRALLGGRVRIIPVGSAPLNDKVLDFLRCALGCHILEGYGQTECVAASTVGLIGDYTAGHVGVPLASSAMKLIDVPDMGYFVAKGKGEVVIRGSIVFKGYYQDPKKTAETVDAEGWLHTGDIGQWTEQGTLKIVDRKKDIFKLAQGEYIAPAKIEDIYAQSPYILQIFVYGDSYKSNLVGFVVPNFPLVQEAFKKKGITVDVDFENNNQLRSNAEIKKFILDELTSVGKMSKLKSFEQVKDILIHPEGFSIEEGLVTPTLKNKRFALKKFFQKQIEELYSKLE
ncbi:PREDICTED: long-chain-fatty-acid--CoA ligase 5-like [Rhagoletis zephyria]|uniref:long-chain-fatty-acid--CoA ligase 5-like n=1 Tax=Rhagoletis zephyria TaxID=28612 RepID=UPI00081135FF|nr:PREDICTED: long-chain-fatty-acid--CoA ligase 5-like [Rhagoletis zephyria]